MGDETMEEKKKKPCSHFLTNLNGSWNILTVPLFESLTNYFAELLFLFEINCSVKPLHLKLCCNGAFKRSIAPQLVQGCSTPQRRLADLTLFYACVLVCCSLLPCLHGCRWRTRLFRHIIHHSMWTLNASLICLDPCDNFSLKLCSARAEKQQPLDLLPLPSPHFASSPSAELLACVMAGIGLGRKKKKPHPIAAPFSININEPLCDSTVACIIALPMRFNIYDFNIH